MALSRAFTRYSRASMAAAVSASVTARSLPQVSEGDRLGRVPLDALIPGLSGFVQPLSDGQGNAGRELIRTFPHPRSGPAHGLGRGFGHLVTSGGVHPAPRMSAQIWRDRTTVAGSISPGKLSGLKCASM